MSTGGTCRRNRHGDSVSLIPRAAGSAAVIKTRMPPSDERKWAVHNDCAVRKRERNVSKIQWCYGCFQLAVSVVVVLATGASLPAQLMTADSGCADGGCSDAGWAMSVPFGHSLPRPFDSPDVWMHGHHQRPSSYAGYSAFRPYNYRHVAVQSRLTANWPVAYGAPYALARPAVAVSFPAADRRGLLQRLAEPQAPSSPATFARVSTPGARQSAVGALRPATRHSLRPVPVAGDRPVHVFPRQSEPAASRALPRR